MHGRAVHNTHANTMSQVLKQTQTDIQTDRQTDRQTHTHTAGCVLSLTFCRARALRRSISRTYGWVIMYKNAPASNHPETAHRQHNTQHSKAYSTAYSTQHSHTTESAVRSANNVGHSQRDALDNKTSPRQTTMRATAMMKKIKAAFVALFFFPPTASVSTFSSATISPPSACPVICACVYLLRITAARLKNPPCRNAVAPVQWQPSRANTHVQGVYVCV